MQLTNDNINAFMRNNLIFILTIFGVLLIFIPPIWAMYWLFGVVIYFGIDQFIRWDLKKPKKPTDV